MKTISENEYAKVLVMDEPGEGGACHEYEIGPKNITFDGNMLVTAFSAVSFQKGAIQENGVNGCQIEDLLAIAIHRLDGFQSGEFACKENALAMKCIEDGLSWLNLRTKDRQKREVEGTNVK